MVINWVTGCTQKIQTTTSELGFVGLFGFMGFSESFFQWNLRNVFNAGYGR